jgi:hypothetical protein
MKSHRREHYNLITFSEFRSFIYSLVGLLSIKQDTIVEVLTAVLEDSSLLRHYNV